MLLGVRHKDDKEPKGVMFIDGCFVEPFDDPENEAKGHWGFKIITKYGWPLC